MNIAERLLRLERLIISSTKKALNTDECALYLGVTPDRVRRMAQEKLIPSSKFQGKYYFDREKLEQVVLHNEQLSSSEAKEEANLKF